MLLLSLIAFFIFLLLSAFFASSETAFISLDRYRLDYLVKKGNKKAKSVKKLLTYPDRLLATILIGNTFVNAATASLATFIFVSLMKNKNQAVLYATLTTTFLILLLAEITPKIYAAHHPQTLSFFFIYPLKLITFLFAPIVKGFTLFSNLILRIFHQKPVRFPSALDEEEIKVILTTGMERSNLPLHRRKMLTGILEIRKLPVKEIMIPRTNVVAIEIKSSFRKILNTIISSEYSRFPVYRDRLDEIEGAIHSKDVIPYLVKKKRFNIYQILREPFFVPESVNVEIVLRQMQENNVHLAIVVDEYGSIKGIITLEDILEEIVGEIRDEYDLAEEKIITPLGNNIFLIQGYAPIKEINQTLNTDFPEKSEYTTLAGFILSELRRIPNEKDEINYQGIKITIQKMKGHQIKSVKVILREKDEKINDEDNRNQQEG
ncbi:MAG: hemolysin family protein [Candidatus Aminicenantia bacterium]